MHTLTDTNPHRHKQAVRQLCPHKHASWSYLNLATHTHTRTHTHTHTHTHKQTNCPDGIWLCDLGSVVWGSLLLNPLNALGIPPSSSLSLSLLYLPPSVPLYGWMNTYHSADKEPSTLELALSLRAMFTPCERSAFHRCFIERIRLIQQRWERGVEASFSAAKTSDTHTILHPINFNTPGRSIVPYLPHFHVWGNWASRQNKSAFFMIAWWGLQWAAFWHRTVSMKAETTKSILKHHNRWEPQNFNIGFLQISLRVDSFLKAVWARERERKKQRSSLQSGSWRKYSSTLWRHAQSPTLSCVLIISSFGGLWQNNYQQGIIQ